MNEKRNNCYGYCHQTKDMVKYTQLYYHFELCCDSVKKEE